MTTPKLFLQGDTRKAKTWIPWAKKQLNRLKGISDVVNQVYRPAKGIAVHVKSVVGIDNIRIVAVKKVGECKLFATITPLGGKLVQFEYKYKFDDKSDNQAVYVDTGGINLTGNNRYFSNSFNPQGQINTTQTFLNTGNHTITSFAQANDTVVSHDSGIISVFTYQAVMDVSSIAPKASLIVQVVSDAQVQCLANGTLYATTNDGTRRRQVITLNVPVVDTMIMDFISLSPTFDIVNVAVIFRQYNCLATDTQIITVT